MIALSCNLSDKKYVFGLVYNVNSYFMKKDYPLSSDKKDTRDLDFFFFLFFCFFFGVGEVDM